MTHLVPELPDRYRLERVVGRGGMGVVVAAWDSELERSVALKFAVENPAAELRERFRREAQILARIRCPQVVEVYHFDPEAPRPWISMELIQGSDLSAASPEDPSEAYLEVAKGLVTVHAAGLLHRDVKPSNVVLTDDGRVVLIDFGLAMGEAFSVLTTPGQVLGTPLFMAPEIAAGSPATPASDFYSWGASLYMGLEERPPFEPANLGRWFRGEPVELTFDAAGPETPLARLLRACLSRDPDRRPTSLAQIRSLLEERAPASGWVRGTQVLSSRPSGTEVLASPSPPEVPVRPPAPRPGRVSLAAAGAALAGLLLAWAGGRPEPPPSPSPAGAPARLAAPDLGSELEAARRDANFRTAYESQGAGAYEALPGHRAAVAALEVGAGPVVASRLRRADDVADRFDLVRPFGDAWTLSPPASGWPAALEHAERECLREFQALQSRAHYRPRSFPGARSEGFSLLNPEARVLLALGDARAGLGRLEPLDAFLAPGRRAWRRLAATGVRALDALSEEARAARLDGLVAALRQRQNLTYGSLAGAAPLRVVGAAPRSVEGRYLLLAVEDSLATVALRCAVVPFRDPLERARRQAAFAADVAAPAALRRRAWLAGLRTAWARSLWDEVAAIDGAGAATHEAGLSSSEAAWLVGVRERAASRRAQPTPPR